VIANELFDRVASPKSTSESAMPPRTCVLCDKARAILKRPKTGQQICRECFFYVFETEVHNTITQSNLFKPGDRVAIGASGGKGAETVIFSYHDEAQGITDSTVLAYVMKTLNERYSYGLELFLLSIDEGITGYRDDSLEVTYLSSQNRRHSDTAFRRSKETSSNMTCL
jgi:cytoplasmic tRNA 2-thiolation protein 1